MARHGWHVRELSEKEGFSGLFRALERGAFLPVAATLAPLLDELDAGTDDRRSER
jgi:hypothetical protein